MSQDQVTWARVHEILEGIIQKWTERHGEPLPGIHDYHWNSPQQLAANRPYGRTLIETGLPARETNLVRFLTSGVGTVPRMPRGGPYLGQDEIEEIVRWIDAGMPEG